MNFHDFHDYGGDLYEFIDFRLSGAEYADVHDFHDSVVIYTNFINSIILKWNNSIFIIFIFLEWNFHEIYDRRDSSVEL